MKERFVPVGSKLGEREFGSNDSPVRNGSMEVGSLEGGGEGSESE